MQKILNFKLKINPQNNNLFFIYLGDLILIFLNKKGA